MEGLAGLPRHVGRRPRADANLGVPGGIRGGPDIPPYRGRHFSGTHIVKHRPGHGKRPPVFADPRDVVPVDRGPEVLVPRAPAPDRRPGTPATSRRGQRTSPGAELADCIIRASGPATELIGELLASLLYNNCRIKREPAVNRSARERTLAAPRGPVWSLPCTGENVLSRPVPRVWCPLGHRGAEFVVSGPCGRSFEAACCRFAAVSATEVAQ